MDTLNNVLSVTFDVTGSGLCLDETHLYANVEDPGASPVKGAPGGFPFKRDDLSADECVQVDPYVISDFVLGCGEIAALAAHAVVCESMAEPDWQSFSDLVDSGAGESGTVMMRFSDPRADGRLTTEILNGGVLEGIHDAWHVDVDRGITLRTVYEVAPIPTYVLNADGDVELNPAAANLVEYSNNLDLVNWVINRDYPGQPSACGGHFTSGDVQRAIWDLVENNQSTAGIGPWSQCRANEIMAEATIHGGGFAPGLDQSVAVILNPVGATGENIARISIAQVAFSEIVASRGLNLGGCETAWGQTLGGDIPFPRGNRWGTFFEYVCE
jgi:PAS domain-containing protein